MGTPYVAGAFGPGACPERFKLEIFRMGRRRTLGENGMVVEAKDIGLRVFPEFTFKSVTEQGGFCDGSGIAFSEDDQVVIHEAFVE